MKGKKIESEMERKPKGKRARRGGVTKGLREVTLMCAALVYVLYMCVCSAGNSSNWALLPRPCSCLTEASQRGSVAITLATGHSAAGPHPPPVPHLLDEIFSVHVLQLDLALSALLFLSSSIFLSSPPRSYSSCWLWIRRSRPVQ